MNGRNSKNLSKLGQDIAMLTCTGLILMAVQNGGEIGLRSILVATVILIVGFGMHIFFG